MVIHAAINPYPLLSMVNGFIFFTSRRKMRVQYFLPIKVSADDRGMQMRLPYVLRMLLILGRGTLLNSSTFSTVAWAVTGSPASLKYTRSPFLMVLYGVFFVFVQRDSIVFSPESILLSNFRFFAKIAMWSILNPRSILQHENIDVLPIFVSAAVFFL